MSSCASTYHAIEPELLDYSKPLVYNQIQFSYRYDVLSEVGNKKYPKKEKKNEIKVIAIKIVNNSKNNLLIGRDFDIISNENKIELLNSDSISKLIKQPVLPYLLYLAITPIKLTTTNGASVASFPIGYGLGPILAFGNLFLASNGNSQLKNELRSKDLTKREIKPGETVTGIISIKQKGFEPLSLNIK